MTYDTIILGAGASGLMTAAQLKRDKILIIEGNDKVAQKVKISGGGRCNITNEFVSADNYLGDKEIVSEILTDFDEVQVMDYFHSQGLKTVKEKNNQYFCKHSSQDLIDILLNKIRHVKVHKNEQIEKLSKEGDTFTLTTSKQQYHAKNIVIATGGASFPKIGATDIGLKIAQSFEIQTRNFEPVLVGLTVQKEQFWMKELSGISCRATITVGKKSFTDQLLFAHKGISGPAVLSASLYWKKGSMIIDFLPDVKLKQLLKDSKKLLSTQLPLSKRLSKLLLEAVGVEDKSVNKLTMEDKDKLSLIKSYHFAPAGTFGLSKAEATRGGVLSSELDQNLQSRKIQGLYFVGEVVDVTGELGGYNFQWAFASATRVAKALQSK
ncbi:MAG: aminoacetone oxidase family FAD-binding enzyme [Thiovulaceae bacterium]|nr:aminoacetone oxidase family FAD-binding enzyme [Sulfurimonadaceae bacterium]